MIYIILLSKGNLKGMPLSASRDAALRIPFHHIIVLPKRSCRSPRHASRARDAFNEGDFSASSHANCIDGSFCTSNLRSRFVYSSSVKLVRARCSLFVSLWRPCLPSPRHHRHLGRSSRANILFARSTDRRLMAHSYVALSAAVIVRGSNQMNGSCTEKGRYT